jgi:hypothetical protein
MAGKALTAVIQEAYIQGVSPRSVDDLVKDMGMSGVSKSQVSRLCEEIDERSWFTMGAPLPSFRPRIRTVAPIVPSASKAATECYFTRSQSISVRVNTDFPTPPFSFAMSATRPAISISVSI